MVWRKKSIFFAKGKDKNGHFKKLFFEEKVEENETILAEKSF